MSDSIFTKIIEGAIPASVVYRDDLVVAFMDTQPVNQGHVLVVPITPVRLLEELDQATSNHLFYVGRRIAMALRHSTVLCEGVNLFMADGEAAGQKVPHVHLHVIPRLRGDGLRVIFPDTYFNLPPKEELDEIARGIRLNLE